jgi:DNA-binding winged helix-turn-helix (wHTH) protein/tetratricopeptide (TPR) repeat protein/TolB-like protein
MMSEINPLPKILWQFDEFLVDPMRRLLTRDGEAVALTPKSMSILLVLLEKQGEVVTKQDLIQRIWPDTFVTEANLTQNVSSLRKALGERANARRYIVTVPGLGYSFAGEVVPVELIPDAGPETGPEVEPSAGEPERSAADEPAAPSSSSGRFSLSGLRQTVEIEAAPPVPVKRIEHAKRGRMAPVLFGLAALAIAGAVWFGARRPGASEEPPAESSVEPPVDSAARSPVEPPAESSAGLPGSAGGGAVLPAALRRSTVAVLGFRNLSGAKEADWLASALAEMLTTELGAGSRMRVISGENVLRARRSLSLPYTDRLERKEMDRLHSFLGADLVVVGAYLSLGSPGDRRIRLDLRVLKVPEGDTVASLARVGTEAELFELIARSGAALREVMGVGGLSEDEIRAVRALRPVSSEAARLYTEGIARLRTFDPPAARDYLVEAARADPSSALIHSALSKAWTALGYDQRAVEEARQAVALSHALSREDRLAIEAHFQEASRDWAKASETYRTLFTFFPDDLDYGLQLTTSLMMAGRVSEADTILVSLRNLPGPVGQDPRIDLLQSRVSARLSDFPGEQRAAAAAVAKGRQSGESLIVAYAMVSEGDALRTMGRTDEAVQRFQEARRISEKKGYRWVVGMALSNLGVALQSQGDLAGAEEAQKKSLEVAQELGTALGMATQYFQLGEVYQDRGELKEALKAIDQSTSWFNEMGDRTMEPWMLNIMAGLQTGRGDLDKALRSTERAVTISRETGNRGNEAQALQRLGTLFDLRDDLSEARVYYLRAFQLYRSIGDTRLAASALAAAADVTLRQGDLPGARRRFEHALAAKRRSGDRIGMAQILGAMAELSYQSGDLAASRSLAEQQLSTARQSGSRSLATAAFQNLGRVQMAAGDLAAARRSYQDAMQLSTSLGEDLKATAARLGLAQVALAEANVSPVSHQPGEAIALARTAAAWYGERRMRDHEARALAVLAEAYLLSGDLTEARQTAVRARIQAEKSENRELRIAVATRAARVESAAGGDPAGSLQVLAAAIADAEKAGLLPAAFEARLALGEIQAAQKDRQAGDTLDALRAAATARGFNLLARLSAGPVQGLRPLG